MCYDLDTKVFTKFIRPDVRQSKFREYAKNVDIWIGHNVIQYDVPCIEKLIGPGIIPRDKVVDTLVLSWLEDYQRQGGHSLDNWGSLLGVPKYEFNDFSRFSLEMLDYCTQDVYLNAQVYLRLWSQLNRDEFKRAIALEHKTQWICHEIHNNGFAWNFDEARRIQEEIQTRLLELDDVIQRAFPPKSIQHPPILAITTKNGQVLKRLQDRYSTYLEPNTYFSPLEYDVFNPGSPKQIIGRLHEAGWNPTEKTEGYKHWEKLRPKNKEEQAKKQEKLNYFRIYGWRVNENNLATLPEDAPEGARLLVERMLHASRLRTLEEWFEAYNPETGRIHGTINAIGAWTQRKSHRRPNTANIAAEKSLKYSSETLSKLAKEYGRRMRSLWMAGPGRVLVGTDAEGIQLRILAHYLKNKDYVEAICNGRKEDKTDIHSVNQRNIGEVCRTRDDAKTFIYALLLGAGIDKIANILKCDKATGGEARERFIDNTVGYRELKDGLIRTDASRGFFIGLDGRIVRQNSEHLMLAGYLQNGESTIMKLADARWQSILSKEKVPFWQVGDIHDEWQTETIEEYSEYVGKVQADAITWAGEELGLLCPLAGSYSIGRNWYETH